jgi:hypothetical protein
LRLALTTALLRPPDRNLPIKIVYLSDTFSASSLISIRCPGGYSLNRYHATAFHYMGAIERELEENGLLQKHVEFLLQLPLFMFTVLLSRIPSSQALQNFALLLGLG